MVVGAATREKAPLLDGFRERRWVSREDRQAIRRGTFTSVKDLIAAIETFIDGWNERSKPFVWTKTADQILTQAHRKKTSNTDH